MPQYENEEYLDMVGVYAQCNFNGAEAAREYENRFPRRNHYPDARVIIRTYQRYRENRGNIDPRGVEFVGRPRSARTVHNEERVLTSLEEDPSGSSRKLSRLLGISQSTVNRITQSNGLHPYHATPVQNLHPGDFQRRIDFCNQMLAMNQEDPNFLKSVLFTDESLFTQEGCFNQHNIHLYGRENPHFSVKRNFQQRWKINMWGGIIGDTVLLYELPETMNGNNYLTFIRDVLPDFMEDIPLAYRRYFQHDGAPIHFTRPVTDYLNTQYPGRWIGRNGPLLWPARSPDLTPLDYFLWGYIKEIVYTGETPTRLETMARVMAAPLMISPEILNEVRQDLIRRCRLCLEARGATFEQRM